MESTQLEIDLAAEKFNFSELSNLNEITSIRFNNYTDKIDIPLFINDYSNITELYFSSSSKDNLYQTPDNLEKLIHIKKLTLWSYCDFSKLKPMSHLEWLYGEVKNTETDVKNIIGLFPNLKHLEIWGDNLDNQNLPDEIGNLTSLESLHLASCGLTDLPHSFINLKQLKELDIRGRHINTIPEEITQLANLEVLRISQPLTKLPDSLSNLKKLKKLNLYKALNGGNTSISSYRDTKIYLKPIPDVIGRLENLEDLNLGTCGVFDITPILPLKKLKKLNLEDSALKNCDGFSNFELLEELDLQSSYDLKNLDGLNGLPLRKLNISSNFGKSLNVISSLELLEELNIKNSDNFKDFFPVYKHSGLKTLHVNPEILEKWQKREQFNKLPKIDEIINQLLEDKLQQFEQAVLLLSQYVEANYNEENNPLASYFNIETEEEEMTFIEVLDSTIQKHLKNLSDTTLVNIFGMTFKNVGDDNYQASLLVLEEIIARKNVKTQQQIIKEFYKACKYYDAGHRYWAQTVHDQLIDELFAQFTSEALYKLLKKASPGMLYTDGGDGMDKLFIPAFKNTTDIKLQEKLLNVFLEYENKARGYYGKSYFDRLLQQINDVASAELQNLILRKKEDNKEPQDQSILLENINENNFPDVIDKMVNQTAESFNRSNFNKITFAARKIILPETSLITLLDFIVKENDLPDVLVFQYHKNKKTPEKIIDFLKAQVEKNNLSISGLGYTLKRIIEKLSKSNTPLPELEIYENFMVNHFNMSLDEIYNLQIKSILNSFFFYLDSNWIDNSWMLEKVKTISLKMEGEIHYTDLKSNTYDLVNSKKYETAKKVFEILHSKTKYSENEGALFHNIIAAIKLNDEPYFDVLYKEVQKIKKISEVLLAYNLACAFAHFERKEELLFYIKESIRLGKMKQQFLDDTDFEKYWNDTAFLEAINQE